MDSFEGFYKSANGVNDIFYYVQSPDTKNAAGIVQIVHGMNEHAARYADFATFLTKNNYIVCQNEHLGHGKSAKEMYGWFGEKDGDKHLVQDVFTLSKIVTEKYPSLPLSIFGHSMGSFIARQYVTEHGEMLNSAIFSGTCGSGALYAIMHQITSILVKIYGGQSSGHFLAKLNGNLYNAKFKPIKTGNEWLSRDLTVGEKFSQDKLSNFPFTLGAYKDMFALMSAIVKKNWFKSYPKELPSFFLSGLDDPVGSYGRGVLKTYSKLIIAGAENTFIRLYEGGRHEMLNELNKDEVYADILHFLQNHSFPDDFYGGKA